MNDFIPSPPPPSLANPNPTGGVFRDGYGGPESQILDAMKRAKPWIMFLSVLGYIGAGMMILLGLVTMVGGLLGSAFGPSGRHGLGAIGPAIGVMYIVLGAFYFAPSYLLGRYASSIGRYADAGGPMEGLADAVQKQTTFWRFVGISAAVMMGLYALAIVGGIAFAMLAAAVRH